MQEVWEGKGDRKLIYKHGRADTETATTASADSSFLSDPSYVTLKKYGQMCTEEKFTVLPGVVRQRIANIVDEWVKRSPVERVCVADSLVGSLTLMAHGTHQIYLSFDRFINCTFDDSKLLKVLRCYKNCVPEPGTYFGEIVAQFFQHCKQQSNLNVKRTTTRNSNIEGSKTTQTKEDTEEPTTCEEKVNVITRLLNAELEKLNTDGSAEKSENDTYQRQDKPTADMDRKFEVIMSLKRAATVVLMFVCVQKKAFPTNTNEQLESHLKQKIFGTRLTTDGKNQLDSVKHEFSIKQFDNTKSSDVYFSLTLYRKHKYEEVLDDVFQCVDIYNASVYRGVRHRLGICSLVYCSDTLYFMRMSQALFIDNSVTFLYCFLTEKYRPVIETKEDSFVFGLVKILSSIEYFTECSLKRSYNGKTGHGPLTSVISEGGLNESTKYVNNLFRSAYLCNADTSVNIEGSPVEEDIWDPKSPSYSPGSPPFSTDLDAIKSNGEQDMTAAITADARRYVINEPYINTFLNRPVECGSMY